MVSPQSSPDSAAYAIAHCSSLLGLPDTTLTWYPSHLSGRVSPLLLVPHLKAQLLLVCPGRHPGPLSTPTAAHSLGDLNQPGGFKVPSVASDFLVYLQPRLPGIPDFLDIPIQCLTGSSHLNIPQPGP